MRRIREGGTSRSFVMNLSVRLLFTCACPFHLLPSRSFYAIYIVTSCCSQHSEMENVSSYCQDQGSINCAFLPSRYPWFPIFNHFDAILYLERFMGTFCCENMFFVHINFVTQISKWHTSAFPFFEEQFSAIENFLLWFLPLYGWWRWCW